MFSCCDCRKDDSWRKIKAKKAFSSQQLPEAKAGVGIVFKPSFDSDAFMALVVHDVINGSSANVLANIQRGDILQAVDGIDIFKRPAQEVSGLLLGAPDTTVQMSLFRELTPEESRGLQLQHLTYPQHLAAGNRIFELYSVVAKRTIPIDTGVGTQFPGPSSTVVKSASPVVKSSTARTPSTHLQRAERPNPSESTGSIRGIESRSPFSIT